MLSAAYLLYSIIRAFPNKELLVLTLRQYMLFAYMAFSYLIFNLLVKNESELKQASRFIILISKISVAMQLFFLVWKFIALRNFSLFSEGDYNYFSPLCIMGIITYASYILAKPIKSGRKYTSFFLILLLSTTVGHSSAFLSILIIFGLHLLQLFPRKTRLPLFLLSVLCMMALLYLPQFSDDNASWRLLYWKHIINQALTNFYGMAGHGFGHPYMTYEYALLIKDKIGSSIMIDEVAPLARYLSPPHNSFLSIAFHIGLFPALLLLAPAKKIPVYIFTKNLKDDQLNFLILSLAGCSIWSSFNVILELPHSSTYFWLIYFTTALALQTKQVNTDESNNKT